MRDPVFLKYDVRDLEKPPVILGGPMGFLMECGFDPGREVNLMSNASFFGDRKAYLEKKRKMIFEMLPVFMSFTILSDNGRNSYVGYFLPYKKTEEHIHVELRFALEDVN